MPQQVKTLPHTDVEDEVREPPLYKVVLLNDDFTPQDFVVALLERVFAMSAEQATVIMLQIHRQGSGVCGVYDREIAEIKMHQVHAIARRHEHPLKCVIERA
jgi:ATP-dependent Clp protease adaptor protein ClpS